MYNGTYHKWLMEGVEPARAHGIIVEHKILSAGYGLIDSTQMIAPYDVTYNGMPVAQLAPLRLRQDVPMNFNNATVAPYDVAIILLGQNYLRECVRNNLPLHPGGPTFLFSTPNITNGLVLTSGGNLKLVPCTPGALAAAVPPFRGNNITCPGDIGRRFLTKLTAPPPGMTPTAFIRFLFALHPPELVLQYI
jgi:hypothetical protein